MSQTPPPIYEGLRIDEPKSTITSPRWLAFFQEVAQKLAAIIAPATFRDREDHAVRASVRLTPAPVSDVDYSTALYISVKARNDTDTGPAQVGGINIELYDQTDAYGVGMSIAHYGAGDAIYVPMFTDGGAAFEAASFHTGTKGIISTVQTTDCFYTVLFNGLWGQPTEPGYGLFYADHSPAKAFVARRMEHDLGGTPYAYAATSCQFELVKEDLTRLWGIRNDGAMECADHTLLSSAIGPVSSVYACTNATPPTQGTWSSIGTQTIGAETVTYYKRTA